MLIIDFSRWKYNNHQLNSKKKWKRSNRVNNCRNIWYSHVYNRCIHCWKFPRGFSQSKIGGRVVPSSACVFIALKMAYYIQEKQCPLNNIIGEKLGNLHQSTPILFSKELLNLFGNAIIDGNEVHELANNARRTLTDTFNIPDAIKSMNGILHEIDFMIYEGPAWIHLYNVIKNVYMHDAVKNIDRLCFILIAMERAILLVCERRTNTIFVFDSHGHNRGLSGAFVSAAKFENLAQFCMHLFLIFFPDMEIRRQSERFEISCIQSNNMNEISQKIFPRKTKRSDKKNTSPQKKL